MFYLFVILLIASFIIERDKLLREKKNLGLFLVLSIAGITLGIVHMTLPYVPSIAMVLEKYLK